MTGRKQAGLCIASWFLLALLFGYFQLARQLPFWAPPLIPVSLTILATTAFIRVDSLRRTVLTLAINWLVSVAFLRLLVMYNFILYLMNQFPGSFSIPASTGAALVALTAIPLLHYGEALETRGRTWLKIWNLFALFQLLSVILLVAGHLAAGYGPALRSFARLPLNLFPTFIVPVSMTAHLLIMYRLKRLADQAE